MTVYQLEIRLLQNFVEVGIGAICFAGRGNGSLVGWGEETKGRKIKREVFWLWRQSV